MLKRITQVLLMMLIMTSCSHLSSDAPASNRTLDEIKSRGTLKCGVNTGLRGIALMEDGRWEGLDVDICRAMAVAILGDATKVEFVPLSAAERFTALQKGQIDILSRNSTVTLSREVDLGLTFAPVTFYDGQGFLVNNRPAVYSLKHLKNRTVCVQSDTTNHQNLLDAIADKKIVVKVVALKNFGDLAGALQSGKCQAISADITSLAAIHDTLNDDIGEYRILTDVIAKEPLAPVLRQGDHALAMAARWVIYALVEAEELGIQTTNVADLQKSPLTSKQKSFLAVDGSKLGLQKNFAADIVQQLGNYGEIYRRHYGQAALKLDRGSNALWVHGGLMYAPPVH